MDQQTVDQAMRVAVRHHNGGQLPQAEVIYRHVLASVPNHPEALHLLGLLAKDAGRVDEAIELICTAIKINPANAMYHSNLGVVFRDRGHIDQAIGALNRAIEIKPDYSQAYNHLGNALRDGGRLTEAVAAYREALRLQPEFAVALSNLGSALRDTGELDQAIAAYREAIRLRPDYAIAHRNLGNALNDQGSLDEASECLQKAVSLAPDDPVIHNNLLFAIAHHPDRDEGAIHRESRDWALRHAAPIARCPASFFNDTAPQRRLKIAYISKYFCESAESHYILPLMANHDHERFEIFLYSDVLREDKLTARIRGLAGHWHSILGLSDANVADLIREHRIDIVVFIPPGNRLLVMARKPAPLLLTWLFSASSSGLGEIDYRVSDPFIDPVASDDSCYSEQTLRLPQTAWCYDPLVDGASVSPLPAIQNGYVTFGSLVRLCKINRSVLAAWSAVLKSVAGSRLFLLAPGGVARQRVLDSFASFEIDPQRIHFVPRHSRSDYLQTYRDIDIVLDTFPYNGHTTTLDAMWMGVPVVTLAHRRPVGRVGTSLLTNVGLTELIAENPEQYVSTAIRLADDLAALAALRAGLRRRLEVSPLMDGRGFALNMESAYRRIWQDWCQSRTGATRSAPPTADRF